MSFFNTGNRVQKDTPIVLNLVIINVLVFIAQNLFNKEDLSLSDKLAIHNYSSDYFEPYQIVTNMFAHELLETHSKHHKSYQLNLIFF